MIRSLLLLVATILLSGCTTVTRSFPGHAPANVWTALSAVAETPDYAGAEFDDRWFVRENQVWLDQANLRIEIYRKLDRVIQHPTTDPRREKRTWRFQVRLEPTNPPVAVFTSRGWGVPMQAHAEGERYFADVWRLLQTDPALAPAVVPPAPPAPEMDEPPPGDLIDLDDLDLPE